MAKRTLQELQRQYASMGKVQNGRGPMGGGPGHGGPRGGCTDCP